MATVAESPVSPTDTAMKDAPSGKSCDQIPETDFAGAYRSVFVNVIPPSLSNQDLACLGHVNCNYLSTTGIAPTLEELKQHAQSLAVLIKHITLSTSTGIVNNYALQSRGIAEDDNEEFIEGQSFDWLNDLSTPYQNSDRHHHMPLTALLNTLSPTPTNESYNFLCPLHASSRPPKHPLAVAQPYATKASLIAHANEILELLDHQFSATGGLLSIFPQKASKADRDKAESTILGQLILFAQRLVQRLHDIERHYANTLDALTGEAVAPHQSLSRLGPHGRAPRELVYPQDRFVLVNAGDDVFQYLQSEFDRRELINEQLEANDRAQGLMGEAIGDKGIVALDVTTRYYRLRNDPLKTVFVIPAYEGHPGTKVTREWESAQTVVSVVKPLWPERVSVWEQRQREAVLEGRRAIDRNETLTSENEILAHENKVLRFELAKRNKTLREYQRVVGELDKHVPMDEARSKLLDDMYAYDDYVKEVEEREAALVEREKDIKKLEEKVETTLNAAKQYKSDIEKTLADKQHELEAREHALKQTDENVAKASGMVETRLQEAWRKQIEDTQVILEALQTRQADLQGEIDAETTRRGVDKAQEIYHRVVREINVQNLRG